MARSSKEYKTWNIQKFYVVGGIWTHANKDYGLNVAP